MKIIFDDRFLETGYADDNAAMAGRMEAALSGLRSGPWEFVAPAPATAEQLLLAHDADYLRKVAGDLPRFRMASLAAGGAILAARTAHGENRRSPACALRATTPRAARPGATAPSATWRWRCWCCARNGGSTAPWCWTSTPTPATAPARCSPRGPGPRCSTPLPQTPRNTWNCVEARLSRAAQTGILAVSAGFDAYRLDVGHKLDTPDFERIGALAREAAVRACRGRRFAVLEGGYYLPDLGANVLAFCRGFAG